MKKSGIHSCVCHFFFVPLRSQRFLNDMKELKCPKCGGTFTVDEAEAIKPNIYLANRVNMKFLLWARAQGRVYYATNEDGIILEEFTKLLKIKKLKYIDNEISSIRGRTINTNIRIFLVVMNLL